MGTCINDVTSSSGDHHQLSGNPTAIITTTITTEHTKPQRRAQQWCGACACHLEDTEIHMCGRVSRSRYAQRLFFGTQRPNLRAGLVFGSNHWETKSPNPPHESRLAMQWPNVTQPNAAHWEGVGPCHSVHSGIHTRCGISRSRNVQRIIFGTNHFRP